MCGIAGIAASDQNNGEKINQMLRAITHRGPDDKGTFHRSEQIWLGHQRLAVLDLSPLGHQPMVSRDGRFTIVFNGEIYNFRSMREELVSQGDELSSHSDTEVILELYARQGPTCISRLDGMFAFAIWDNAKQQLFCARDPLGIKPFYYWHSGHALAFASEVRSVLQAELGPRRLCAQAVQEYLLYGSVQEPLTLVEGIRSLPAGHTLTWSQGQIEVKRFWQLDFADLAENPAALPYAEVRQQVRAALDDSVARHFVSDVPVGIFLSGGIDSTAVLALAHAQDVAPLQTFCISFEQPEFDEGDLAKRTAEHFRTNHHQWRMSASEGKQLFANFLNAFDQPSNDGFNTYCVSHFARQHGLKVVLSGLGGDELFGGYPSFQLIPKLLKLHAQCNWTCGLAALIARMLSGLPFPPRYQRLLSFLQSTGSAPWAHWAVRGFFLPSETRQLMRHFGVSDQIVPTDDISLPHDVLNQVAFLETTRYMRNQLLRDSDVMSMAVGLELRTPLVDRKLVDDVAQIPAALRLQPGKKLLTDAVPEIPAWILGGPKRGFRFPFENWISGEWGELFASLDQRMPIQLNSWSRKWTLLVLEHFIRVHRLS
ncbi:MAG: asparagine synthase (glutamine-hydrolyzing) [Pirellulaceae bacterium]|nr:asparagine synthase (glutamine-hydrolyzing) [Pirellulaceae bacterium]